MTDKTEIYQRRTLGILGMLLPLLDVGFGYFFCRYVMGLEVEPLLWDSISSSHYSSASLLFEGTVFAVGCFLICYRGYDVVDYWITTLGGIMALILTLFPTSVPFYPGAFNFCGIDANITKWVHNVSAITFFFCLAFMEIFQFTKTSGNMTNEKKKRNVLYRTCGIVMIAAIFLGGALSFLFKLPSTTYIGEGIGLEAFGIAWLVKGETLLKDKTGE